MTEPLCHLCPLAGRPRLQGVNLDRPRIVLGQAPGETAAYQRRPFAGQELATTLLDDTVGLTYAIACYSGRNAKSPVLKKARACCAPRVTAELEGKQVLAMGAEALHSAVGKAIAVGNARGTEAAPGVTATWAPAYAMRAGGADSEVGKQMRLDIARWLSPVTLQPVHVDIDPKAPFLPPPGVPVVVDIETTGLDPAVCDRLYEGEHCPADVTPGVPAIRCIGFAWEEGRAVVFTGPRAETTTLLSGRYPLIAQNYAFERKWFTAFRWETGEDWHDTMLLAHALYEDRKGDRPYSLDALTKDYAPQYMEPKSRMLDGPWCYDEKGRRSGARAVLLAPLEVLAPYCGWDCAKEWALWTRFSKELGYAQDGSDAGRRGVRHAGRVGGEDRGGGRRAVGASAPDGALEDGADRARRLSRRRYETIALPAAPFLDRIQETGLRFSPGNHAEVLTEYQKSVATLEKALRRRAKLNWNAPQQVARWMAEKNFTPPSRETATGLTSLDLLGRKELYRLNPRWRKLIALYHEYRWRRKVVADLESTSPRSLLSNVRADGRIHPRFNLTGTATGRLSASSPGLHNFDAPLRRCIVASPRHTLVEVDYSRIELLLAGVLSGEPLLLEPYRTGADHHQQTADRLKVPRSPVAKGLNFGCLYGQGGKTFKSTLDKGDKRDVTDYDRYTIEECMGFVLGWHQTYRTFMAWRERLLHKVRAQGCWVASPTGAVRRLPALADGFGETRWEAERQAVNHPIQNWASDMTLYRALALENTVRVLALKHDSILYETTRPVRTMKHIREVMTDPVYPWGVLDPAPRVEFKMGKNWAPWSKTNPDGMRDVS